jgi:hypothetical protein
MPTSEDRAVLAEIPVVIDYGQIFVFLPSVTKAGLLWTDDHVKQGFAWASGITCFGISDHDGYDLIRIETSTDKSIAPEALWAIRVPFEVERDGVQVGTVGVYQGVPVPQGKYSLVFEALTGRGLLNEQGEDYTYVLHLKFCPDPEPDFAIIKQGSELETDKVLQAKAEYA